MVPGLLKCPFMVALFWFMPAIRVGWVSHHPRNRFCVSFPVSGLYARKQSLKPDLSSSGKESP